VSLQQHIMQEFERHFESAQPTIVRAPGRVNLIGEHTDYNDGFVLPIAINRAIWIALRPHDDGRVIIHSLDFNQTIKFVLKNLEKGSGWAEYIKGVAWALQQRDYSLRGFEGIVAQGRLSPPNSPFLSYTPGIPSSGRLLPTRAKLTTWLPRAW
jgi:galactokinase